MRSARVSTSNAAFAMKKIIIAASRRLDRKADPLDQIAGLNRPVISVGRMRGDAPPRRGRGLCGLAPMLDDSLGIVLACALVLGQAGAPRLDLDHVVGKHAALRAQSVGHRGEAIAR